MKTLEGWLVARRCVPRHGAEGLLPGARPESHAQRGSVSILLLITILVMLAFTGIALDTAMVYNRRAELQGVANAAALAAAGELNGTAAGVNAAVTKAAAVVQRFRYSYDRLPMRWSETAIEFSTAPTASGTWKSPSAAASSPAGTYFVRIDTSELAPEAAIVEVVFMRIIGAQIAATNVIGRATAGRSASSILPLAICAMSEDAAAPRANPGPPPNVELVEYGFRRGVGYDLMRLNPNATTPANFLVNPIDPPGTNGSSVHTSIAIVGPYICTGTMAMASVNGGPIRVDSPFPLGALYRQLNSRFDQYDGNVCSPNGAPPDYNIKSYDYGTGTPWMGTAPSGQSAATLIGASSLGTIADPAPAPTGTTAPQYGPLWSFARAVPYSAYSPTAVEPANGYATFPSSAWPTLYRPGQPTSLFYPSLPPYMATSGANFQAPSAEHRPGRRFRRVLNIPLLSCPVSGTMNTPATVLAIGRFFMTVPASATSLHAEFAGVAPASSLLGPVELYP